MSVILGTLGVFSKPEIAPFISEEMIGVTTFNAEEKGRNDGSCAGAGADGIAPPKPGKLYVVDDGAGATGAGAFGEIKLLIALPILYGIEGDGGEGVAVVPTLS
jgi:hypothetical protein